MRIVIKGADFSSVSIGKVVKDLSFSFYKSGGTEAINAFFPNYNSGGTVGDTTYYLGSSGGTITSASGNARLVSDFHEVDAGMNIKLIDYKSGGNNTPAIIYFNSQKEIVSGEWNNTGGTFNYTVPNGVKYVKFQHNVSFKSGDNTTVEATMPE